MRNILKAMVVALMIVGAVIPATAKKPVFTEKEQAKIEKQAEKEAKKTAKVLKKEGWKIEQTGLMESIIARHMIKLQLDGLQEKIGAATDRKTRSGCRKQILNDVSNAYAREQSQIVKGVITSKDRFRDGDEAEDFIGEYEARLASEIAGELIESYSLYKKNTDGTYDMQIYYLVDPERAHAAKLRAARNAMEIQKLDEEWRKSISEAINDTEDED